MPSQGHHKTISDMFGVFLESLGDRYDGHPYAGLVYDAIVKAEEMLCDDTPPSLAIFVDALEHNRDVNNKKALSLSNGCFDEHMRLQDKERLAEQFFRVRGLLNNDQKINFQRYEENRQFSMAVATRTKESVIDLLDEIETSNRVIDCFKPLIPQSLVDAFNIPEGPFLEPPRNHAELVKKMNPHMLDHPRDRINDGVNPLRAIREDQGLNAFETATLMGMEVERYAAIEKGYLMPSSKEILHFCDVFDCYPYDLTSDNHAIPICTRDALLELIKTPDVFEIDDEEVMDQVLQTLMDDVSDDNTITRMQKMAKGAVQNTDTKLIADFLYFLLKNDGAYHMLSCNSAVNLAEEFIEAATAELVHLGKKMNVSEQDKANKKDRFDKLGWRLYRKGSEWGDLNTVYKYLYQAKDTLFKGDAHKMIDYYAKTPASIGHEQWPSSKYQQDKRRYKTLEKQIAAFNVFCDSHHQLLRRFENRQVAIHHDEMPQFISENVRQYRVSQFTI